jgi:hypothetical protein
MEWTARVRFMACQKAELWGGGKPHRIIVNSRVPSAAVRTTRAKWSGKTASRDGMLLGLSTMAFARSGIAFCPLVMLYRSHRARITVTPANENGGTIDRRPLAR